MFYSKERVEFAKASYPKGTYAVNFIIPIISLKSWLYKVSILQTSE
jgi:hypothetical protein